MSSRAANRSRINALEQFVRAFDELVAVSQRAATVGPADEGYTKAREQLAAKQREVSLARARVRLDG